MKTIFTSAVVIAISFGLICHASAQNDGVVGNAGKHSRGFFFSFGPSDRDVVLSSLSTMLETGRADNLKFKDSAAMRDFYKENHDTAVWIDLRDINHERAVSVFHVLEKAWSHGLNPESYHVNEIRNLLNVRDPSGKARLELLISDAIVRYAQDLNGFHLSAGATRQDASYWRVPEEAGSILAAVSVSDNVEDTLESYAPQDMLYKSLRKELMTLAGGVEDLHQEYSPISFGGRSLWPGDAHGNVPKLRERMAIPYNPAHGQERQYDDDLVKSVIKFQQENGLAADGVIGPKTLDFLNLNPRDKIDQVIANMERLRWTNIDKPDRYILVNIPSATLWAVDHGKAVFEIPVIVGRPERQTKSFVTEITGVRFNPKWTVPPTIKVQDFLPKLVEDPNYLQNKGIEVSTLVDGQRQTLDSSAIDWANITRQELSQLRMVQDAGDNNALGRIRVLMDNPYDIYLHDTSTPEYFKKTERALSSGCIRLSDPEAVAQFILAGNEGWSKARMEKILASERTTEIPVAEKIPVYIVYQTMWLDGQDHLVYGRDIYKLDRKLVEVMAHSNVLHIQKKTDVRFASTTVDSLLR